MRLTQFIFCLASILLCSGNRGLCGSCPSLHLAAVLERGKRQRWLTLGRAGILTLSLCYGAFLLWFQFARGSFCPWCLAVLALLVIIASLGGWQFFRPSGASGARGYPVAVTGMFAAFALLLALTASPREAGKSDPHFREQLARWIDDDLLAQMAPCGYLENAVKLPDFRTLGGAEHVSPVVVTLFWDPFCPACRRAHRILRTMAEDTEGLFELSPVAVRVVPGSERLVLLLHGAEKPPLTEAIEKILSREELENRTDVDHLFEVLAAETGTDAAALQALADSPTASAKAKAAYTAFKRANPDGTTPAIVINERTVNPSWLARGVGCLFSLIGEEKTRITGEKVEFILKPERGAKDAAETTEPSNETEK